MRHVTITAVGQGVGTTAEPVIGLLKDSVVLLRTSSVLSSEVLVCHVDVEEIETRLLLSAHNSRVAKEGTL